MPKALDLTNATFGRLTVIERAGSNKHGTSLWRCVCSCSGREIVVPAAQLRKGESVGCGCYQREATAAANRIHGQYETRMYRIWKNMIQRATSPNHRDYVKYGGAGRGLDDPRWRDFESFAADMAGTYRDDLTLDRIDGTKGYSKSNCRWATHRQQNLNTNRNKVIDFRGERKPAVEWAESLGLNYKTVLSRLRSGWSVERTLTTPTPTGYRPKRRGLAL